MFRASFRPRLAATPLRFTNPSPPSGWVEDFHLQAIEHARHTIQTPRSYRGVYISHSTFHYPLITTGLFLQIIPRRPLQKRPQLSRPRRMPQLAQSFRFNLPDALACLLRASFRPRLATTPLRFTNPSLPSRWVEDFHLQAIETCSAHQKKARGSRPGPSPSDLFKITASNREGTR